MNLLLIVLTVLSLRHTSGGSVKIRKEHSKLPNFLKICHRSDERLNSCALSAFNSLKPRFADGIAELFIPPLEPLVIPEIRMDQNSGAIYLHSTYKNIKLHGLSNMTLTNLNLNPKNMQFDMEILFHNVTMEAQYEMNGKIMLMPLIGKGVCRTNFTNLELKATILGQSLKKNGRLHIKTKDIKVKYSLGKAQMYLENLFNGDVILSERMNAFLNEHWESLSDEIRPLMENVMAEVIRASTDKLFAKYSYDDLLPE